MSSRGTTAKSNAAPFPPSLPRALPSANHAAYNSTDGQVGRRDREAGEPHRHPHGRGPGIPPRRRNRPTIPGKGTAARGQPRPLGGRGGTMSIRVTVRLDPAVMPVIRSRMAALGAPTLSRYVRQLLALDLRYTQAAAVNPVGRPPAKSSTTAQPASADAAAPSCPPSAPTPPTDPLWTPQPLPEPEAPWGWCPACGTRLIRAGYHRRCNCCGKLYEV
jgi:hypothetical protein